MLTHCDLKHFIEAAELTPWYPSSIHPARNGFYQVKCVEQASDEHIDAYWKDGAWLYFRISKKGYPKYDVPLDVSCWRGLAGPIKF